MYDDIEEKLKALSFKEIIGYAIGSEDAASNFYWMIVKVFEPNDLVRNKFESIARDEELHMRALLNLHEDAFGDKNYTVPDGLPPFESVADVEKVESLIEALNIAMENEMSANKVYNFLAKEHKDQRKLFKYLAQTELGHYNVLKEEKGFFDEEVSGQQDFGKVSVKEAYRSPMFKTMDVQ
jgi:rubrerythrin